MLSELSETYDLELETGFSSLAPFAKTETTLRCISVNTHRGQGPKLPYLLSQVSMEEAERIELLHDTKAYTYYIAEWLNLNKHRFAILRLSLAVVSLNKRARS